MITKNTPIGEALRIGKECKKCGHCCKHGTGLMKKEDVSNAANFLGITAEELRKNYLEEIKLFNTKVWRQLTQKKPFGPCVFLKKDKCTIHEAKPLHCRIGTCKEQGEELTVWYKLNYLVNPTDPESLRQFKVYIETGGKIIPGGELKDLVKDKKLLNKILNYEVLK